MVSMTKRPQNIAPNLPQVGQPMMIAGLTGTVTVCEPASDYSWYVEITVQMGERKDLLIMHVPTDFRTDDRTPANR